MSKGKDVGPCIDAASQQIMPPLSKCTIMYAIHQYQVLSEGMQRGTDRKCNPWPLKVMFEIIIAWYQMAHWQDNVWTPLH